MYRNDSSIDPCRNVKIDKNHLGQLFWPVSQVDVQRIMLCFHMEGHTYAFDIFVLYGLPYCKKLPSITSHGYSPNKCSIHCAILYMIWYSAYCFYEWLESKDILCFKICTLILKIFSYYIIVIIIGSQGSSNVFTSYSLSKENKTLTPYQKKEIGNEMYDTAYQPWKKD